MGRFLKTIGLSTLLGLASLGVGECYGGMTGKTTPSEAIRHAHKIADNTRFYPTSFAGAAVDRYQKHGDIVSAACGAGTAAGVAGMGLGAAGCIIGAYRRRNKKKEE